MLYKENTIFQFMKKDQPHDQTKNVNDKTDNEKVPNMWNIPETEYENVEVVSSESERRDEI